MQGAPTPSAIGRAVDERRFRRVALQAALFPGVAALALAATLLAFVFRIERVNEWVHHTDLVIERGYRLQSTSLEEEGALRGYLLSGDRSLLAALHRARRKAPKLVSEVEGLVADNPAQAARLREIAAEIQRWNESADRAVASRQTAGDRLRPGDLVGGTEERMEKLGALQHSFVEREEQLRTERIETARKITILAAVLGCAVSIVFGVLVSLVAGRQLRRVERTFRQALTAQQDDHDKLRLAQEASRIGTYEWNARTNVNRWSPELEALYGILPGTFDGTLEAWAALVHPDDLPPALRALEEARESGNFETEFRILRPDGQARWLAARGRFFRDRQGRPERLVGVNIDISDRKAAADELRNKQERLEVALEAGRTGTFRWDIRNDGLVWDENLDRLFGLAPRETARSLQAFIGMVHLDDRAGVIERCSQCASTGVDFDMEFRVIWPDGSLRWLLDRGRTFKDANGRPVYMTGACVDVTDRKRVEDALRLSEARLRELADAMPQIVWTATADGRVDYQNRKWFEITGSVPGQPMIEKVHPDDVAMLQEAWRRSVRGAASHELEFRIWSEETRGYRWVLTRALPIRDASGKIERWYGTCTDIEEKKRGERALEDADRRKDQFLAMLAHELRNPLAPIRSAVEVLRLISPGDERLERYRGIIERQTTILTRLVDDLLDVSRVTRGTIELRKQPVDAAGVLARAVETSRPLLDRSRQQLEVRLPQGPISVFVDPERTAQIFANLINNASKYSAEGTRVVVSVERQERLATFRFNDEGRGIPPEKLEAIFEIFTQLETTIDRSHGGLGIGLTLVRALAELQGGTVTARSDGPGTGSEFVVHLPLAAAEEAEARPPPGRKLSPARQARRILVLDDNRDAADMLAELLSQLGDHVEVTYDPAQAVELALRDSFDFALLDLGLPGMDGFEVARRIRASQKPIVLVALSGYGQASDRERARDAGFDHHLVKPADPAAVTAILDGPKPPIAGAGRRAPANG